MYNGEFEVEDDQLILRVDLSQELGESSSGKSVIIATTGGNVAVPGWEAIKVGLNTYPLVAEITWLLEALHALQACL